MASKLKPKADGVLEAIAELNREVFGLRAEIEVLQRQAEIQKRVRGAARQLAIAEQQLLRVVADPDLSNLGMHALRQRDTAKRVFYSLVAGLPEWSYEAEFNVRQIPPGRLTGGMTPEPGETKRAR